MRLSDPPERPAHFPAAPDPEVLPVTDRHYESSLKGLFVIGDVAGLPLVKIAANQGVDVVEHMEKRGLFRSRAAEGGEEIEVAIVGGGPAGLSAALEVQKRGVRCVVLERARLASTIRDFPRGKHVYAEPRLLKNRSEIRVEDDPERNEFLMRIQQLVKSRELEVREGVEVTDIRRRSPMGFELALSEGAPLLARYVILAIGRQGRPRPLEAPGAAQEGRVAYRCHTPEDYDNQDLLVVGGGNSAVEAALMLCGRNRVTLSYRRDAFFRLKPENALRIEEAVADGRVAVKFNSTVREVGEHTVSLDVAGQEECLANDRVIALLGNLPEIPLLRRAGMKLSGVWTKKRVFWCALTLLLVYVVYFQARHFALHPDGVEDGVRLIPGFSLLFGRELVPPYFANAYGFYYLVYFSAIALFGVYGVLRYQHRITLRRNIVIVLSQWTLWWGIPVFLVVYLGRNPWTPLIAKSINAWPLNMSAFDVAAASSPGDPEWWFTLALAGVVWSVFLTFVVLPLVTLLLGKHYCSHVCAWGALAETVGDPFRHRAPKGDAARRWERVGFVFLFLASLVTCAHALGWDAPLRWYNLWVGLVLSGALAVGLYPAFGPRLWCRYCCPLGFWMNFWGRWSRFRISPEPGKCVDCNVCNQYCQMGIDIKSRAMRGIPVTLEDTPCVACGECVARCPMEILHMGQLPLSKETSGPVDSDQTRTMAVRSLRQITQLNESRIQMRQPANSEREE